MLLSQNYSRTAVQQESEHAGQDLTERKKKALGKDLREQREGSKTVGEQGGKSIRKGMINNLQ